VCPDSDPVETGSWTINRKPYRYRIAIPIQEVSRTALTNYLMWFEVHTDILVQRGFYCAVPHGYEGEFSDGLADFQYNYDSAMFNGPRTRYFVRMSLSANQSKTLYYYFDPLISSQSSNYNSGLTFSITVPDNGYLPRVNFPLLSLADVYLDGNCVSFPYDLAFTRSDSTTQLYQTDASETLKSDINNSILFNVKLTDAVPQNGSVNINVWYNNPSQTTRHSYWSASNTHSFWDDFESGTTNWFTVSGTWTTASQQVPIYRGGPNGYARAPYVIQKGSQYYLFTESAMNWGMFANYGGTPWIWKLPATGWDYSIGTSLSDFLYLNYWSFEDRPADARSATTPETGTMVYMNSVVQDSNGLYWATYTNGSGNTCVQDVFLAYSTDLIHWTPSSNNPIIRSGGWFYPHNSGNIVGGGCLFWDEPNSRWIMYTLPIIPGRVRTTNGTVYAWVRNNASPDGPFTYYGIVRNGQNKGGSYIEEVQVVQDGGTYYMFAGDLLDKITLGYLKTQRIRVATSSSLLGPFKDQGCITLDLYDWDYIASGMPKLWKDADGNWYMVYFGQPSSASGISDTTLFDNFIGYAKATSFPMTWAAQNIHKMYHNTTSGISVVNDGRYSNSSIYASILLRYHSTYTGLIVRYQDSNNYYKVVFARSDNTLKLYKVVSGTSTVLSSVALPWTLSSAGTSYPLQVCCYGNRIIAKISQYGTYWYTMINTTDNSLSNTGNMGVYDPDGGVYVDDVAVDNYIYPELTYTITSPSTEPTPVLIDPKLTGGSINH